ncbi:MAG TPA: CU044_2847 family protein [Mycobacteriales bacterium]|nr:CU044_2847 family protein [Mycobacteriales bacterium]
MGYLIEVPVEGGGRLVVEAGDADVPADLELASVRPGEVVTQARESLERALDQLRPAVSALSGWLTTLAPDEVTIGFGLRLSAEAGVVVAKGTSEVHFDVTLTWQNGAPTGRRPDGDEPDGDG